jgi:hypothetical protein
MTNKGAIFEGRVTEVADKMRFISKDRVRVKIGDGRYLHLCRVIRYDDMRTFTIHNVVPQLLLILKLFS